MAIPGIPLHVARKSGGRSRTPDRRPSPRIVSASKKDDQVQYRLQCLETRLYTNTFTEKNYHEFYRLKALSPGTAAFISKGFTDTLLAIKTDIDLRQALGVVAAKAKKKAA